MELNLIFIFLLLATRAYAGPGEDNINNLFSDLGPLLSLFGEQFAKQYMSASMGWLDNIAFAFAPLGIITAIVAAIRVSGPVWLKALIGRARENKAAAEIELMSSTSHEVGELWNGTAIVRSFGQPQIAEILFLKDTTEDKDECGLYTLKTARDAGYLTSQPYKQIKFSHSKSTDMEFGRREHDYIAESASRSCAPNISLNLHQGSNTFELFIIACAGAIAQGFVVLFAGIISLHPKWKDHFKNDDIPDSGYAFPLFVSGTVSLTVGLLICTAVIEKSTDEVIWQRVRPQSNENQTQYGSTQTRTISDTSVMKSVAAVSSASAASETTSLPSKSFADARIMWLQKRHVVSDQSFESFIIFAKGTRDQFLTSRRAPDPSPTRFKGVFSNLASSTMEWITLIGSVICLIGFVVQFQAFRGLHWSVSVAQLIAMALMTALRAWVRRNLTVKPIAKQVEENREVDWIALNSAANPDFWQDHTAMRLSPYLESGGNKRDTIWNVYTAYDNIALRGSFDISPRYNYEIAAWKALKVRNRLSALVPWTGATHSTAKCLASAIESIMEHLFSDKSYPVPDKPGNSATFQWGLKGDWSNPENKAAVEPHSAPIQYTGRTNFFWYIKIKFKERMQKVPFQVTLNPQTGKWKIETATLESAISLWLTSISTVPQKAIKSLHKISLGGSSARLTRDLNWWSNSVYTARMESASFGFEGRRREGMTDFVTGFYTHEDINSSPTENLIIFEPMTALTYTTSDILARQIFSSFMWAIAEYIPSGFFNDRKGLVDTSVMTDPMDVSTLFLSGLLKSKPLDQLISDLKSAGSFASTAGIARSLILPPLSAFNKLPSEAPIEYIWESSSFINIVKNIRSGIETQNNVGEAVILFVEILSLVKQLSEGDRFALKSCAVAIEFYSFLSELGETSLALQMRFEELQAHLRVLKVLYKIQRREEAVRLVNKFLGDPSLSEGPICSSAEDDALKTACKDRQDQFRLSKLHLSLIEDPRQLPRSLRTEELNASDILGYTPLHYAIAWGSPEKVVSEMIKKGASLEEVDICGWSPLHYLAYHSQPDISLFGQLLQKGSGTPTKIKGTLPIHCAAKRGNVQAVELILRYASNINVQDYNGWTPLHHAAYNGQNDVVDFLIKKRADPNIEDLSGKNALIRASENNKVDTVSKMAQLLPQNLHHAASRGSDVLVKLMLENGADPDAQDEGHFTPLHRAVLNNRTSTAKLLINPPGRRQGAVKGANPNAVDGNRQTSLFIALGKGFGEMLQTLIDCGADPEIQNGDLMSVLIVAVMKRQTEMVRLLLEKGVNANAKSGSGDTALEYAARTDYHEIVGDLMRHGGDPTIMNRSGETPLHTACIHNSMETISTLVRHGADPDTKNVNGRTPLHLAASAGKLETVKLLLKHGADMENTCTEGLTALHYAAFSGSESVVEYLIAEGANIHARDGYKRTPLHHAADAQRLAIIRRLAAVGADINIRHANAMTALHEAVDRGHIEVVRCLLELGADTEVGCGNEYRALHYAAMRGNSEIAVCLLEYGASPVSRSVHGWTPLEVANAQSKEEFERILSAKYDVKGKGPA